MFDVSFGELLVVVLLAVVFIRPSDVPKIMKSLGVLVGKAKKIWYGAVSYFEDIVHEAEVSDAMKDVPKSDPVIEEDESDVYPPECDK